MSPNLSHASLNRCSENVTLNPANISKFRSRNMGLKALALHPERRMISEREWTRHSGGIPQWPSANIAGRPIGAVRRLAASTGSARTNAAIRVSSSTNSTDGLMKIFGNTSTRRAVGRVRNAEQMRQSMSTNSTMLGPLSYGRRGRQARRFVAGLAASRNSAVQRSTPACAGGGAFRGASSRLSKSSATSLRCHERLPGYRLPTSSGS
jgi:hypothetical protein